MYEKALFAIETDVKDYNRFEIPFSSLASDETIIERMHT